ncbi:MAG: DUF6488 family protein [Desulfobacterales bacterium]|nr:DUF6488 family protein [Desulfobacterales bacterium]
MPFKYKQKGNTYSSVFVLLAAIFFVASIAFSHGGKHAPGEFTHLQALKKATELYDQLIGKGKLDQSWENTLSKVNVIKRVKEDKDEIVVSFQRASGDPQTVYIFFDAGGKYSGSNFTGE